MHRVFTQARIVRGVMLLALCAVLPLTHAAETTRKGSRHSSKAPAATPAADTPAQAPAPQGDQFVDGIAAVVNKDVITLREVNEATAAASAELTGQKIQLPPPDVLQKQVLQRLIMQRLEKQEATRLNIKIDDRQIDQAIAGIASRNKITVEQMRKEIEKTTTWNAYRTNLANEILADRLRQRVVDSGIVISDAEVDAFLKEQARRAAGGTAIPGNAPANAAPAAPPPQAVSANDMLTLGQILVRVPDGAAPQTVAVLRKKAEDLLARLKSGNDFGNLAAAASDGPEALQGGNMGSRPLAGWPDLFVAAVSNLSKGQVSGIIQSGNGFHILKVLDRSGGAPASRATAAPQQQAPADAQQQGGSLVQQGPMQVTQTHARHILIKTSAVMTDDQAKQRLDLLRQRIVSGGEDFGTLARQNSNDASAPQGGDLGWLSPGETVPPFEQAMNSLKVGEVSQPIQSPFGWHLIQVLERREKDVADEMQRLQARRILFERRAEPAFEDWLDQLRDQAYIDNRLEKRSQSEKNNQ